MLSFVKAFKESTDFLVSLFFFYLVERRPKVVENLRGGHVLYTDAEAAVGSR